MCTILYSCPGNFYPRSPCGERPLILHMAHLMELLFLSTLSLRRATALGLLGWLRVLISIHALLAESDESENPIVAYDNDFYPRSPCGERLPSVLHSFRPLQISIHALLAESDPLHDKDVNPDGISIHALLAESDTTLTLTAYIAPHFYPRSPCGERRGFGVGSWPRGIFLSTLSLRRATCARCHCWGLNEFLSTLSLRRATVASVLAVGRAGYFYPRSPCGERLASPLSIFWICHFYPRSPCGERRLWTILYSCPGNFYPRSPCGERLAGPSGPAFLFNFYPRSPCGERPPRSRDNSMGRHISIHALLAESD